MTPVPNHGTPTLLPLALITTRAQIRTRNGFEEESLRELAASIKEHGVLQPLHVTSADANGLHTLVIGERRLLAASLAGLAEVPVIVRDGTPAELAARQAVENLQREDLAPADVAEGLAALYEVHGRSWREVARAIGKSPAWVSKRRALTRMRPIATGLMTAGVTGDPEILLAMNELERLDPERAAIWGQLLHDGAACREDIRQQLQQLRKGAPTGTAQDDGHDDDSDGDGTATAPAATKDPKPATLGLCYEAVEYVARLLKAQPARTMDDKSLHAALEATVSDWLTKQAR